MLRYFVSLAALLFVLSMMSQSQTTYTWPQLTSNNTAACSADGYGLLLSAGNAPAYCSDLFPATGWPFSGGWDDDSNPTYVITQYHDPSPAGDANTNGSGYWNIAKGRQITVNPPPFIGDMHNLMYGGGTGAQPNVVVEVQGWFCNGQSGDGDCNHNQMGSFMPDSGPQDVTSYYSHATVQYTAWDQAKATASVLDIWDRGGDTIAGAWYGAPEDCPPLVTESNYTSLNYQLNQYTHYCDGAETATDNKFGDADQGFQDMVYAIQNELPTYRSATDMKLFLINIDGAWTWICGPTGGTGWSYEGQDEPWCAANKMIKDLEYLGQTYHNSTTKTAYATYNSLPIIGFFQNEGCTSGEGCSGDLAQCATMNCVYDEHGDQCSEAAGSDLPDCYMEMYQQVRAEATTLFGTNGFYMIFAYKSGCPIYSSGGNTGHPDSDGCYAWPQPTPVYSAGAISYDSQEYSVGGLQTGLDGFYYDTVHSICAANGGLLAGCKGDNGQQLLLMGGAFKGFDDLMTNNGTPGWYAARVSTQGCGATWLSTWQEMNQWFSPTSNPLPYMMVATWDDYEEGTELETGIDNCILTSSFVPTISGSELRWGYRFHEANDPSDLANPGTIDHYDLYYTPNGCTENCTYTLLDRDITSMEAGCDMNVYPQVNCSTGVNLNNYDLPEGQYDLFVEAVGKAGLTNWVTPVGVEYSVE